MLSRIILLLVVVRVFTLLFLLCIKISAFDHSAHLKQHEQLIRWDILHFISNQPKLEQDWAFSSGIRTVFKLTSHHHIILATLVSTIASIASTIIFFLLTLHLSDSINYSTLVSLLHTFSPAPSTQVVPYTEPFYALFSFAAIYLQVVSTTKYNKRIPFIIKILAALLTALATSFRSIGVIQTLQWIPDYYQQVIQLLPLVHSKKITALIRLGVYSFQTLVLALITCSPFIYDQWKAYQHFCITPLRSDQSIRPWCSNRIPTIYGFVQAHYWNNGFLNYWTWGQAPLFALSLPVYMASFGGIWTYYRACLQPQNRTPTDRKMTARPFLDPRIAIHVHIQLAITLILLFFSHVQIFLRQASTLPAFWWGLADGIHRHWHASSAGPKSSSSSTPPSTYWAWWFPWIVAWTPISVVLWAGFYPPA